jgi:hypothetical protein
VQGLEKEVEDIKIYLRDREEQYAIHIRELEGQVLNLSERVLKLEQQNENSKKQN